MTTALQLSRPRRGAAPPSDVKPGTPAEVGLGVTQCLQLKGFAVIAGSISEAVLAEAGAAVQNADFLQPASMIQEGLLGFEGSSRVAAMGLVDEGLVPGFESIDNTLDQLSSYTISFQEELLGIRAFNRSQGYIHEASFPEINDSEITDKEANEWMSIFATRKLGVLIFIGPGKGTLELRPYDEESNATELTTEPGLIVVYRADMLSAKFYAKTVDVTYACSCYMLQPDIARMPKVKYEEHLTPPAKELEDWIFDRLKDLKESQDEDPNEQIWDGSEVPRNFIHAANRTFFNRTMTKLAGVCGRQSSTWNSEVMNLSCAAGIDLAITIPSLRWEHGDVYDASPNAASMMPPKTNCHHATFMDGVDLFDAKQFGLSVVEVKGMDPSQRVILEVTYEALYKSGMRKGSLTNALCGMYVGIGSSEWNSAERSADVGIFGATGGAPSICAGRLSFCLGCRGASLAIDTESASSATAMYFAAESVEKKGTGVNHDLACGMGIALVLAKAWWPAHSAAGFLCREGRCMTFDQSAGGHIRGENVSTGVVRRRGEIIDGEEVIDERYPAEGNMVGMAQCSSGRSASMSAPNSSAIQATLVESCRKSGIMPSDVDILECHGSGKMLYDAIEVDASARSLRDEGDAESLFLGASKSHIGNAIEGAGNVALFKAVYGINWGVLNPNIHLRQMNAHLDDPSEYSTAFGNELQAFTGAVFVGVSSFGFGGTFVNIHVYGGADEDRRPPPNPTPEELKPKLMYWPGGGGALDVETKPKSGYSVQGTFNNWKAQTMQYEGDGTYSCQFILGPNRWEQFNIFLDGDEEKLIHPGMYKAPKGSEVHGPNPEEPVVEAVARTLTWFIDARSALYQAMDSGRAALTEGGEDQGSQLVEIGADDVGVPGQPYKVSLHISGKYRMVTWTKVPGEVQPVPPEKYYICASWEAWSMTEMKPDGKGVYYYEGVPKAGGEFQIMRNSDTCQAFFPETAYGPVGGSCAILGPTDPYGPECVWILMQGLKKNRIQFQRSGDDVSLVIV